VHQRMVQLVNSEEEQLSVTEPVVMEVLAGARTDHRERDLRRMLLHYTLLRFDPAADFDAAARIYRRCRAVGFTPRGMVDCMISAVAWRHGASLLAQDVDLVRVRCHRRDNGPGLGADLSCSGQADGATHEDVVLHTSSRRVSLCILPVR
jgi:predicted nucleic acid-binding protein